MNLRTLLTHYLAAPNGVTRLSIEGCYVDIATVHALIVSKLISMPDLSR